MFAAAGGLLAGRVRRPVGGHGAVPHLRWTWLVVVGVALALLASLAEGDLSVLCDALSIAVLAVFAGGNVRVTGIAVVGLGLVANLGAVVLNNGMPVRGDALVAAGVVDAGELAGHEEPDPRHLETRADSFAWLGAIVPVPVAHRVVSFGDLLILVGLFDAARDLGRRRSRLPEVDIDGDLWPVLPDGPAAGADGSAAEGGGGGGDDGEGPGDQPAATTAASADQDCGAAPSGAAESGSQCSAKPEDRTAVEMEFWKDAALPPSPAHLAARHDR